MISGAHLRLIQPGDAAAVLAMDAQLFDDPWSEPALLNFLRGPSLAYAVDYRGSLAAYLLCGQGGGEADLLRIGVMPAMRRRGLAVMLLQRLQRSLGERGIDRLFLEVRASNSAAIGCYLRLGFTEVGRRKGYYPNGDGGEDALMMCWQVAPAKAGLGG